MTFNQRFLRILLSLGGMGAALVALCACVYVFACVADADWRRVPVAPANTLLPENEGRILLGALFLLAFMCLLRVSRLARASECA